MSKRISTISLITCCILLGACLNALSAKDEPPSNWKSLEQVYAEANLELAKARLAQAKSENVTDKNAVSDSMLAELTAGVQLTHARLDQLKSGNAANAFAPQIIAAEDAVHGLETDLAESVKANSIQAGAVSESEITRQKAEIAVAKARLAALRGLASQPPEVRIQWQINQLQDEVRALWARPLIED